MIDDLLDVVGGQRLAEGRHVAIERAHRAAFVHHREPIGTGLGRRRAVGEVTNRYVEANRGLRRPAAVAGMAGGARGLEDLGTGANPRQGIAWLGWGDRLLRP